MSQIEGPKDRIRKIFGIHPGDTHDEQLRPTEFEVENVQGTVDQEIQDLNNAVEVPTAHDGEPII